ncbi:MAG: GIY-YIG nuclease family protein [Spirosomataceae bacterium]
MAKDHNYYVYILTNFHKTVLYTGMTNELVRRLKEHENDAKNEQKTFAGKYKCIYLVYWQRFQYVWHVIESEKEIKLWKRDKKETLINDFNPEWTFLNEQIQED